MELLDKNANAGNYKLSDIGGGPAKGPGRAQIPRASSKEDRRVVS